jgi:hypothetical protein
MEAKTAKAQGAWICEWSLLEMWLLEGEKATALSSIQAWGELQEWPWHGRENRPRAAGIQVGTARNRPRTLDFCPVLLPESHLLLFPEGGHHTANKPGSLWQFHFQSSPGAWDVAQPAACTLSPLSTPLQNSGI